jgi:hypothetical protein
MKNKAVLVVLAALLALSFISCGAKAPANDPATAAGVIVAATPMCMTSTGTPTQALTVSPAYASDFSASAYYDDASSLAYIKYKAVFDRYAVCYKGQTYEMSGTLYFAYVFSSQPVSAEGAWKVGVDGIFYAEGLSVSGPDFDSAFDADCKASVDFSLTSGSGSKTVAAAATLNGAVAGREFTDAELSISATFQY